MNRRTTRDRLWMATTLVAAMAIAGVSSTPVASAAADVAPTAAAVYDWLDQRDTAGDSRARAIRKAMDRYLEKRGLRLAELPRVEGRMERQGGKYRRLRIERYAPWTTEITNETEVKGPKALEEFRKNRHAALRAVASKHGDRKIEVVVTPDRFRPVGAFWSGLGCGSCEIISVVADVWVDEAWMMEVGLMGTADEPLKGGMGSIREELLAEAESALDLYKGVHPSDLSMTMRRLRLLVPATRAKQLIGAPDVLVVDTLQDVEDDFAGDAAVVEVKDAARIFRDYARYELGRELVPTTVKPVLQDAN